MTLNEYGIWYDDFADFSEDQPELAAELLAEVGEGEWQDEGLFYYNSIEDYAEYELTEGWYIDCDFDRDFNGAPNPMDYIDMKRFGEALLNQGDESITWTNWKVVVQTNYGW